MNGYPRRRTRHPIIGGAVVFLAFAVVAVLAWQVLPLLLLVMLVYALGEWFDYRNARKAKGQVPRAHSD